MLLNIECNIPEQIALGLSYNGERRWREDRVENLNGELIRRSICRNKNVIEKDRPKAKHFLILLKANETVYALLSALFKYIFKFLLFN